MRVEKKEKKMMKIVQNEMFLCTNKDLEEGKEEHKFWREFSVDVDEVYD